MLQAKLIYEVLVESGELSTLYPSMKGVWKKDKNSFLREYQENEDLINNPNTIDLDEVDEFTE